MPHRISKRGDVSPFLAMDVLREANLAEASGRPVIHMEVGQPAAPVPQSVINAAQERLAGGRLAYTNALGIEPLRQRIAQHYMDSYGIMVPVERVVVTTGSSGGFNLAFLAAFDVGAKIGLPTPGYPAYRNILKALGLTVIDIETNDEDRWTLSERSLEDAHKVHGLDGVLVASPANPSGTMLTTEALQSICRFCDENGVRFISDEIYHRLVYNGVEETALKYTDNAFVINSFSKFYCMTGWRIGWMITPQDLVRPVERLAQNLFISAPELSQWAGIAAFEASAEYNKIKQGYADNREFLSKALPDIGFSKSLPVDGAFYFYLDVSDLTNDSMVFAKTVLQDTDVALTPGADFDPARGNHYLRMSFAGDNMSMHTAIERLGNWMGEQKQGR